MSATSVPAPPPGRPRRGAPIRPGAVPGKVISPGVHRHSSRGMRPTHLSSTVIDGFLYIRHVLFAISVNERKVIPVRRTEYDASQAAKRLRVSAAAFRWARHTGLIPDPDASPYQWSRATLEALDAGAVRAAMPSPAISGSAAADRIADALGTPNPATSGEKATVTAFVVRQFVDRGLLVDLSANPEGTLHHPGRVGQVCRREDLTDLVAADTPLGPEQAAARLRVRRTDVDHMIRLGWIHSPQSIEVRFGTSRAGAASAPLHTTASVDTVIPAHPEIDWEQLRAVEKGRRSPLASLHPAQPPTIALSHDLFRGKSDNRPSRTCGP